MTDQAMARLKESTRRNIRTGIKQGITVEASEASAALDSFYELLQETAAREQFTVRSRAYYQDLLSLFRERGQVAVYLARHNGEVSSAREIAEFYHLPVPMITKVLKTLHQSELIDSQRGVG